jgi:DNA-binding transcriptional regulator LsrR (DeoR family)
MPGTRPLAEPPLPADGVVGLEDGDRDRQAMLRAAWLYFMEGQTQEQIARHLGVNRIRVNRMLAAARESGMVQVRIEGNLAACIGLELALKGEFGLRDAVVVPAPMDGGNVRRMVAQEAGHQLSSRLAGNMVLGVGWGRTLRASLLSVTRRALPGLEVVSLTGGLTRGSVMNSYETALRLADLFGANCSYIAGPAYADSEETRDLLMRQAMLVDAFRQAQKADLAYISVGGLDAGTSMAQVGLVGADDLEALRRAGAVGDILGYWIDADGQLVDHPLNRRVLAMDPARLAGIPEVMLIAGGEARAPALRATLRRGWAHTVVTDERTAAQVLGRRA